MELGGRGDEVGSEPDGEGPHRHCKEIWTPFASTGGVCWGVGECQLLRKTWPFSCFTLERERKVRKVGIYSYHMLSHV